MRGWHVRVEEDGKLMDPLLWLGLAAVVAVLLVILSLITFRRGTDKRDGVEPEAEDAGGGQQQQQQMRRGRTLRARAAALRRARANIAGEEVAEEDEDLAVPEEEEASPFRKIGTKKLRKMKDKAEKKVMREQEEAIREDRKKREALREEEIKSAEAEEGARKKQEEEEQESLRLEKERQEHEEYLKLREAFTVEEEGEQGEEEEEEARGVQDFIDYIKREKVVYLENLAVEFNLKTQDAIDRVNELQESGDLTGVIDDRGKFIFISEEELKSVATFIRQRGRVSIAELASASNSLINLQPES